MKTTLNPTDLITLSGPEFAAAVATVDEMTWRTAGVKRLEACRAQGNGIDRNFNACAAFAYSYHRKQIGLTLAGQPLGAR